MTHTPTPWKVGDVHGKRIKELWIHAKGYTCPVAYVNATNLHDKAHTDAHFICRSVNSHDDLVSALKFVLNELDKSTLFSGCKDVIKEALAKAEGNEIC